MSLMASDNQFSGGDEVGGAKQDRADRLTTVRQESDLMIQLFKIAILSVLLHFLSPSAFAQQKGRKADQSEAGFYSIEPIVFSMQQPDKNNFPQIV